MNFAELKTELVDRGFDYLSSTRQGVFVNQAYLEICDIERWPFLSTSAAGAAPLAISDLGQVEAVRVTSTGVILPHEYRETLLRRGLSLATTGTPTRYYITGGTTVAVYPVNVASIDVLYWKVPAELTGTDTPIIPTRYHDLIVHAAARRAYLDTDNYEAAEGVNAELQAGINRMRGALLRKHDPDPDKEEKEAVR